MPPNSVPIYSSEYGGSSHKFNDDSFSSDEFVYEKSRKKRNIRRYSSSSSRRIFGKKNEEDDTATSTTSEDDSSGSGGVPSRISSETIQEISRKLAVLEKDLNDFEEKKTIYTEKVKDLTPKTNGESSNSTSNMSKEQRLLVQSMFDYINNDSSGVSATFSTKRNKEHTQEMEKLKRDQDIMISSMFDYILNQGGEDDESTVNLLPTDLIEYDDDGEVQVYASDESTVDLTTALFEEIFGDTQIIDKGDTIAEVDGYSDSDFSSDSSSSLEEDDDDDTGEDSSNWGDDESTADLTTGLSENNEDVSMTSDWNVVWSC